MGDRPSKRKSDVVESCNSMSDSNFLLATSSTDAGSSAQADVQNGLQQCVDTVPATSHNECVTPSLSNNPSPFLPPAQELSSRSS